MSPYERECLYQKYLDLGNLAGVTSLIATVLSFSVERGLDGLSVAAIAITLGVTSLVLRMKAESVRWKP